jgi:TolB-like protein
MSSDPEQAYFSDGISEELLNLLAKIRELRVISRSSAFSYKGKDIDVTTVAKELNVAHVLEGSVRKSGNKIRITVQLIDARTDTHLWSETYDRTLDDVFVIQDEIAAEIVAQLRITLFGKSLETRKIDPEAYVLYLQARHLAWSSDSDDMIQAETLLKQVLALEPDYVPAMNELYIVYYRQGDSFDIRSREEGKRLAGEMNRKALGVDPDDAVATTYLAWKLMEDRLDPAGAARLFEEAIASDPTDEDINRSAGSFARTIGRPDQAIALGEYAIARNPRCAVCFHQLSLAYRESGRFEEAAANGKIAQALGMRLDYSIAKTKLQQGRAEEALLVFEQMDGRNHQKLHAMAMALYSLGRQAEFEATFAELRKRWGDEQPIFVAFVYAWTGDADAAFDWLDKGIEKDTFDVIRGYTSPFFRNLHTDPRWQDVLERIGMSPDQLAAIEFDLILPRNSGSN